MSKLDYLLTRPISIVTIEQETRGKIPIEESRRVNNHMPKVRTRKRYFDPHQPHTSRGNVGLPLLDDDMWHDIDSRLAAHS